MMSETKEEQAPLDIAKLRELLGKATGGEWHITRSNDRHDGEYDFAVSAGERRVIVEAFGRDAAGNLASAEANAAFISAAKNATGEILDRLERAEAARLTAHTMPQVRPANCHERLRAEGKPYGRSSCEICGSLLGRRCPYAHPTGANR